MKQPRRAFVPPRLHPIGLAALLALAGPAFALPQGATVVSGQVSVATPTPTLQVITQGSARGIVDWSSFSIASGERVRFDQPSAGAVLLNRVTGGDASRIFGQIQSNGRIFLLNPNGVVFGSSARIDVGGLLASSLSLSDADFLAGRYALSSDDPHAPARRGAVRNEGVISAPGGTVALVAPEVENSGRIEAPRGRVGLAAAQQVLVDVEGDGLIFFQTGATEAGNRLAQLGRIHADGGSVELRAAARGSFADTVLNMGGVVQARGLGLRAGQVVIDGGDAGITRIAGRIDVAGTQRGGQVEVSGEKVLLDAGTRIDASGASGGGTVLVGGNWQGKGPQRNAQQAHVDADARIDVSATGTGHGGTAVVWSDDTTRFYGRIDARGGAAGGDGGRMEVSGKRVLDFAGTVDAGAPLGARGSLLLDPSNISITNSSSNISGGPVFTGSATDSNLNVATLEAALASADVTVNATGGGGGASPSTISVDTAIDGWDSTHSLTLRASGAITLNAAITNGDTGSLNLFTNGAVGGTGNITLAGGSLTVAGTNGGATLAGSYGVSGAVVTTGAPNVDGGHVAISASGAISTGAITTTGAGSGGDGSVTLAAGGNLALNGALNVGGSTVALSFGQADTGATLTLALGATITASGVSATGGASANDTVAATSNAGTLTLLAGSLQFGSATAITLSNIENVDLTGGSGNNSVVAGTWGGTLTVRTSGGNDSLAGNGSGTTLVGPNAASTWTIDAPNQGSLAGGSVSMDFSNTGRLSGGSAVDTFELGSGGTIVSLNGGGGSDVLDLSGKAGTLAIDLGTGSATGVGSFASIASLVGNDGTTGQDTTLTTAAGTQLVSIATGQVNAGSIGSLTFSGVGNLAGGSGTNTFDFNGSGRIVGSVTGNGGDTLDLAGKTGTLAINLQTGAATGVGGGFSGIDTLVGNDGSSGTSTTLTGSNAGQTFTISGANAGSVGGIVFSGVGHLAGGTSANSFVFGAGGSLSGNLTGGAAGDTLNLAGKTGSLSVDLQAASVAGVIGGSFSGIATLVGNDGIAGNTTALIGRDAGQTFTLTGASTGTADTLAFSKVSSLTGGSGADTFGGSGSLAGSLADGGGATTLSGAITTGGAQTFDGAVTLSGATTLTSTGNITFNAALDGNQTLVLDSGGALAFAAAVGGATPLAGLTASAATRLVRSGAVTAAAPASLSVGGTGVDASVRDYFASGAASAVQIDAAAGNRHDLRADGASLLPALVVSGTLTVNASGAVTQSGALDVGGTTTIAAGAHAITLDAAGNQLAGAVSLANSGANDVALVNGLATQLGTVAVGSGALSITSGGALTQAGAISQTGPGAVTLAAAGHPITLNHAGNGFDGAVALTGGTVQIRDQDALTLAASTVGSLAVTANGTIAQTGALVVTSGPSSFSAGAGSITLTQANSFAGSVALANSGANDVALSTSGALALGSVGVGSGTLALVAGGAITQSGALTQGGAGAVSLDAGANPITLTNTGNNFRGALTLAGTDVALADSTGLTLAGSSIASLSVAAAGAIAQTGALNVSGASSFDAGAGSITLTGANSFGGAVALANSGANDVALNSSGALQLAGAALGSGTLTLTAGGAISQTGAITQAAGGGSVSIDAGANAITLGHAGNDFRGAVSLANSGANDVLLRDANALALGTLALGSGALTLTSAGELTQSGALTQAAGGAAVTIAAGSGDVVLAQAGNEFQGSVTVSGGAISLRDASDLSVNATPAANASVSLVAAGQLTLGSANIDTGTADLTLSFGTLGGSLGDLSGRHISVAGGGALSLGDLSASGTLALATANGAITQQAGSSVRAAGATSIAAGSGDVTLANAGNDFASVAVSGGAISLRDQNALSITGLANGANQGVSLVAGGALSTPAGAIATGTADLLLSSGATLTTPGALSGTHVSLSGAGGLTIQNSISAAGTLVLASTDAAITQSAGAISVAGTSSIAAGSGEVTLARADNDFGGAVAVSGGAISLHDQNALTLSALNPLASRSLNLSAEGMLTLPGAAIDTGSADLTLSFATLGVPLGALQGRNLSLTGSGGIALGDLSASGTLALATANGAITQQAGSRVSVAGATSIAAGSGDVTLANTGNDFASVAVSGGAISLRDQNALNLSSLANGANQGVSIVAGGALTLAAGPVDTGTADLLLSSGATLTTPGALSGTHVSLSAAGGLTIQNSISAAGTLVLASTDAAITQSAGAISVAGTSSIAAGSGEVTLARAGNDFGGAVAVSGGAISLHDQNALTLSALNPLANRSLSLSAEGMLTLPGATIDTGSADLTLSFATLGVPLGALQGRNLSLTGSGGIALGDLSASGTLALATANGAITQQAGNRVSAAGATSIAAGSGDVTLANTGNDFASVAVSGGAISLRDQNALSLSSLANGANQGISVVAGGALTLATGAIDTGSADLRLASGGALTTPGALSGRHLSLSGAGGVAIGDSLDASGTLALQSSNAAITQSAGAIRVAGATSVAAGSGAVTLARAGNDFGGAVAVSGSAVSLRDQNALRLGALQASSLSVVTGNGAVSQSAAATVSGLTTVDAGSGAVTLTQAANRFGRVAVSGRAVAITDAAALQLGPIRATSLAVTAGGDITQTAAAQVGNASVLNAGGGDITLTQAGNDFGSVALAGAAIAVVDANDLNVTALTSAANRAVSLRAGGTLTLPAGAIDTGSADLTLASLGGQLATGGALAGRSVGLLGSGGIVLGGSVRSTTDQTYATALTLAADATLDAGSGRITIGSGLAGGGHDLSVASAATLTGDVTGTTSQTWSGRLTLASDTTLASGTGRVVLAQGVAAGAHDLTVAGVATLGGSVSGSGHQTFGGQLSLTDNVALSAGAGSIALQGGVAGGGHALTLTSGAGAADAVSTGGALSNLATLTVNGRSTLGGHVTSSGDQHYAGTLALAADATLDAGAGTIALDGAIDGGGHRLGLASRGSAADAIRTVAAIGNVAALTVDGNLALGGNVGSSGAQSYRGKLRLDSDATLSGASIAFGAAVDGAQVLTLRSNDTRFGAAVGGSTALTRLVIDGDAAGTSRVGGNVRTTGSQTWGNAIVLDADATLSGSTLQFDAAIDGAHALTIQGGGATTFLDGAVGQSSALSSLTISGPTTLAGGAVTTGGAQRYDGAVTLAADTRLAGSTLEVGGALDGAHALALQFGGTSTFGGAIGGGSALRSLSSTGAVTLLAERITTSGAQDYGAALRLAGDTQIRASSLRFAGTVSGAHDLLLQTDTLDATDVRGNGVLRITPRSVGTSMGIAGGAGELQISQALVTSAGGFTSHLFGRSDGSGDISANAWRLGADTTLQSRSGDLHLAGSVDGGFDLALHSGGVTRIAGPIGVQAALTGLHTDDQGRAGELTRIEGAGGSARIVTTGAQTYADPLRADVPVQFQGSAISAEQNANHFEGAVAVDAGTLLLRSADGITLGRLTLAQGGRVESDGVLRLAGDLQLGGGTLSLVSNAAPEAVAFTDPALRNGDPLSFGFAALREASATIVQDAGTTLASTAGSLLVLRSPRSGSILLDRAGNTLLGGLSAVSGPLGDDSAARFTGNQVMLGFVRINSSEIHVVGAPPAPGAPDPQRAGIEADAVKLTADRLTTGPDGLLRARLPFLESQGSQTSLPALTLVLSPVALATGGGFGTPDGAIQVRVGSDAGGYVTVRPKEAGGENRVILLAGPDPKPFYDGAGKLSEVRIFYNGDAPRTPQETGALTAVTAIVEDARQTRFEEAVRTENVKSRLRSGVIAEVGAGRPATVGRESIRLPQNCAVKADSLQCE